MIIRKRLNQNGFTSFVVIGFLPAFISLLFFGMRFISIINQKSEILKQCRSQVLNSQNELLDGLEKLLALNSQSQKLIDEKKHLKAARQAPHPMAKVAFEAMIKIVEAQQLALRIRQELIIHQANIKANTVLKKNISTRLIRVANRSNTPKLKVIKTHPREISSPYKEAPGFTLLQRPSITLNYQFANFFTSGFWGLIPKSIQIKEFCESKPKKIYEKWQSQLN